MSKLLTVVNGETELFLPLTAAGLPPDDGRRIKFWNKPSRPALTRICLALAFSLLAGCAAPRERQAEHAHRASITENNRKIETERDSYLRSREDPTYRPTPTGQSVARGERPVRPPGWTTLSPDDGQSPPPTFTATDYEEAAVEFDGRGEAELAAAARERAKVLRGNPDAAFANIAPQSSTPFNPDTYLAQPAPAPAPYYAAATTPRAPAESYYGELNRNGVPKTVYVRSCRRRDGTLVTSHYRSPGYSNPPYARSRARPPKL